MSSTLIECPNCHSTCRYTHEVSQPAVPAGELRGREVKQINTNGNTVKDNSDYLPNKIAKGILYQALLIYGMAVILFACLPYWPAVLLMGALIGFVAYKIHRVCDLLGLLEPGPIKYENVEQL